MKKTHIHLQIRKILYVRKPDEASFKKKYFQCKIEDPCPFLRESNHLNSLKSFKIGRLQNHGGNFWQYWHNFRVNRYHVCQKKDNSIFEKKIVNNIFKLT